LTDKYFRCCAALLRCRRISLTAFETNLTKTTQSSSAFSARERRATSLASLYGFRMLGLFMVLPVLALYMNDYAGASPLMLGLTLGAYGLDSGYAANSSGAAVGQNRAAAGDCWWPVDVCGGQSICGQCRDHDPADDWPSHAGYGCYSQHIDGNG